MVDCESSPVKPPPHPFLPAHPSSLLLLVSPFCKFLNSAQDAQSINKTLSPPLGASAEEATQEPAGLPSKAASVVAPRNADRFGNGQNGDGGLWGRGRRIIETAPSCSCAGASQSKIGGQQREMLSTPKDRRHFTPQQAFLHPSLWNTQATTLSATGFGFWSWQSPFLGHRGPVKMVVQSYQKMRLFLLEATCFVTTTYSIK